MLEDKKSLRQLFRTKRQALSAEIRAEASRTLLGHIVEAPWYHASQNFAAYLATSEEIDTTPLIQHLWSEQKQVYLPRITADNTLVFASYTKQTTLIANRFNIAEPNSNASLRSLEELDVIFMPLVAFDKMGHRLGMGAGFYDKTLTSLNTLQKQPVLIGLAYECQQADTLPHDVWDVQLDYVVTEQSIYKLGTLPIQ